MGIRIRDRSTACGARRSYTSEPCRRGPGAGRVCYHFARGNNAHGHHHSAHRSAQRRRVPTRSRRSCAKRRRRRAAPGPLARHARAPAVATCASRSPTAAISAASTACRRTSSAATIRSCRTPTLLTFEEIARVARVFAGLGVRKLRLTGGEPLLRTQGGAAGRDAARRRRPRPHAHHQRRAARAQGAPTCARPGCRASP